MPDLAALRARTRASLCLACGKCSSICPLAPSGWFSAARMMAIRDVERGIPAARTAIDACLTCAACETRCPEAVRFVDFVRGVRAMVPATDRSPCPHGEMLQSVARMSAAAEAPRRDLGWVGDGLEIAEEGEIGLFVGCLPFFDAVFGSDLGVRTLDIARAAIRLLNRLEIRPVVLAEERCCGHDLLWNGEGEAFEALARANVEAFTARGVRHLLTTCAECCRTWRRDVPRAAAGGPRVEHVAEFLAARIEAGELEAGDGRAETVTYQDPCRLGRHLEVVEAPRRVLETLAGAGGRLAEMEASGVDAACCGTSGFLHCDAASRRLQSERLASAAATGAATLVTACPKCLIHFHCAQSEDRRRRRGDGGIEVQDLTVLAAAGLRRAPDSAASDAAQRPRGET